MMNFALKMMHFALKMMHFASECLCPQEVYTSCSSGAGYKSPIHRDSSCFVCTAMMYLFSPVLSVSPSCFIKIHTQNSHTNSRTKSQNNRENSRKTAAKQEINRRSHLKVQPEGYFVTLPGGLTPRLLLIGKFKINIRRFHHN